MSKIQEAVTVEISPEEYRERRLQGWPAKAAAIIWILLALFVLIISSYLNIQEFYRNTIFLILIVVLGFFIYPMNKKKPGQKFSYLDLGLAVLGIISIGYITLNYTNLHVERMSQESTLRSEERRVGKRCRTSW